jgi:hypothetical protein
MDTHANSGRLSPLIFLALSMALALSIEAEVLGHDGTHR